MKLIYRRSGWPCSSAKGQFWIWGRYAKPMGAVQYAESEHHQPTRTPSPYPHRSSFSCLLNSISVSGILLFHESKTILFPFRVASISHESCSMSNNTIMSVSFKVGCKCGKVQAAIKPLDTAGPSRLVCYCRDCRGYFETLNQLGSSRKGLPPAAALDVSQCESFKMYIITQAFI
jgi:hypothetical protein